jgi:hypothetical protein
MCIKRNLRYIHMYKARLGGFTVCVSRAFAIYSKDAHMHLKVLFSKVWYVFPSSSIAEVLTLILKTKHF